jgi:hypothetical protein
MIVEEAIRNLPTPVFPIKKVDEPQSKNPNLPPLFFSCLVVGSKNSGKTYSVSSLLKLYEENDIYDVNGNKLEQRIIIFSPTGKNPNNAVFKNLKNLDEDDIYTEYDDETLQDILNEIAEHNKEADDYEKYIKTLKKYKNPKIELSDDEYRVLYKYKLDEDVEPIYKRVTHFIFDDLIGDPKAFSKKKNGGINKFLLTHRHYYTNIFFTTQYINAISPLIKNNIDVYCLFKYANLNDIINKFYPLVSGIMKTHEFQELYLYASKDKFNFLTIINHNSLKGKLYVRKNWNINLKIE